ncbi:response regulator [uncultured Desulfosarcina sp.]|uniref:response regulator n=1 Tax=uncultured Desulfosarcina sp. TaxID=218289 RepID=UPI0029C82292|nr:response regulator [uncultured Desulfosarcina sp.]
MMTQLENAAMKYGVPPHILVMEDDLTVAKGLEMVLREDGFDVNLAGTGELAMEAFRQKRFDLLVADLRLPDIDGMEVIRRIKAQKPETEVIVITGYGTTATAVEAMKLGVSEFLPKPFTEDQIKLAITAALKSQEEAVGDEPAVKEPETESERLIQKREVIQVMNRTWDDRTFWTDLMEKGTTALDGYRLSSEAKAAITSGDLRWINENVGELTQKQLMFIHSRLEREAW